MEVVNKTSDPIALAIFQSSMHSIAEEMGAALRRTSISPNIIERRDYSCAVFDAQRRVIAMGDHMPVHLGSMPMSVKAAVEALTLGRGDMVILNDPYAGGTHLPDITMVLPVFVDDLPDPVFYVAARAHHADVGGAFAGSMGPGREIFQEGIRIPPIRIVRGGKIDQEVLSLILHNVRTPVEREGDLVAQIGACKVGERRLLEVLQKYGLEVISALTEELLDYSDRLMRSELRKLPAGTFTAEDFLDDDGVSDGPIRIAVSMRIEPGQDTVLIDFAGSDPQVGGSVNAVYAITYSACFYVLRCLLAEDAPATAGLMNAVTVLVPEGTIVNARMPAAVAGGNVETSQRIVDVLLRALGQAVPERVPAASYGTMSNLTIGGFDHRTGRPFTYYETTAGGMGARPGLDGISGCSLPHDEFAEHTDRGAGVCLSIPGTVLRVPQIIRRQRAFSRRGWTYPRDRVIGRLTSDAAFRSSEVSAVRACWWNAGCERKGFFDQQRRDGAGSCFQVQRSGEQGRPDSH